MIPVKDKYQLRNWELVSINPNNRDWSKFDYFNFWAVSIQSIISFSLIASLYLLYDLNSLVVLSGTLFAGLIVFFLTNLIGHISQNSGLPFPVILRLSMGFNGARYLGLIRGFIGIFMFGVQTFFISKSLGYIFRIILFKIDSQLINHEFFLIFFFGLSPIDWFSLVICLIIQFILFTKSAGFNKNFIKFSSIFIYIGLIAFLLIIFSKNYIALISSLLLSTTIENFISKNNIENVDVISDDKIKDLILSKSIFAISKSGTISLEICSHKIPSIIIYKMNFINFMIVKFLVKIRFANIINIINDREIIPELIQKECNPDEIFKSVTYLLKNPDLMKEQIEQCQKTLDEIKSKTSSADEAANVVLNYLS